MSRTLVAAIEDEYRRYKALGEAAIAQVADESLSAPGPNDTNSIAILVWHIAGNFESRFTDFRTSDGEKPWRHRDDEFVPRTVDRIELMEKWDRGWQALFAAVGGLTDGDLAATVIVRQQTLPIDQALLRSLAHTAYHVGQIVYVAKALAGRDWRWLTIPPGKSEEYNRAPTREKPGALAAALVPGDAPAVRIDEVPATSKEAAQLMAELDRDLLDIYPGYPPHGLGADDLHDPRTRFLVATLDGEAIACGALRALEPTVAEVKRMFVRKDFRRRGLARRMLSALEALARQSGVTRLKLETGARQPEAMELYRTAGFVAIDPYGIFVGNPLSRCYEKTLA